MKILRGRKTLAILAAIMLNILFFNGIAFAEPNNQNDVEIPLVEPHYELYFTNGWYVFDDSALGWFSEEEAGPGDYSIMLGFTAGNFNYTFSSFASGTDIYGESIDVESIVYVLGQNQNETGIFNAHEVYDSNGVITVIATFSDGTVLKAYSRIIIGYIQPR